MVRESGGFVLFCVVHGDVCRGIFIGVDHKNIADNNFFDGGFGEYTISNNGM